jgi:hypothetical protein
VGSSLFRGFVVEETSRAVTKVAEGDETWAVAAWVFLWPERSQASEACGQASCPAIAPVSLRR